MTDPAPTSNPGFAVAASIVGGLANAYAGFSQVRLRNLELRQASSAQQHYSRMLQFDIRNAERRAIAILEQGQAEVGKITLEGGQRRAEIRARAGARGIAGASVREAEISDRLIQDIDAYNINLAAVREANAARAEATDGRNRALFARTSARNLRASARDENAYGALGLGLASTATRAIDAYRYRRS